MTYRRRSVSMQDIATIRKIIESHPDKSRRFISQEVCRTWNWRQTNGVLMDMVCRSLLLHLESKGYIALPAGNAFHPTRLQSSEKSPLRQSSIIRRFNVLSATCFRSNSNKFEKPLLKSYSTDLSTITTIWATRNPLESISNLLPLPATARSPVWHGAHLRGISAHAIGSLAGAKRAERTICI